MSSTRSATAAESKELSEHYRQCLQRRKEQKKLEQRMLSASGTDICCTGDGQHLLLLLFQRTFAVGPRALDTAATITQ